VAMVHIVLELVPHFRYSPFIRRTGLIIRSLIIILALALITILEITNYRFKLTHGTPLGIYCIT